MSKSLGNYVLVSELLKKYDPATIRLFLINSHYRKSLDFNERTFEEAQKLLHRIKNTLRLIDQISGGDETTLTFDLTLVENEFIEAMDDDLNTVAAVQSIMRFVRKLNHALEKENKAILEASKEKILELLDILGVSLKITSPKQDDIELVKSLLELLVDIRGDLRNKEDYAISDKIRNELTNLGFVLKDTPTGTKWRRIKN